MNEPITFFRKRQQDAGHTYAFDLQSSTRIYRVFLYSRRPIEEAVVRSRRVVEWEPEKERIFQAVGPGGAIVWVYEEAGKRSFRVVPVGAVESIFKSYGVLRPGVELSLAEVGDKWLETPLATHLMVPVDREAEEHLREMKEYLAWLPPDLESLILHSIRKPSLDARVGEIEAKVFGDKKGAPTGRLGERLKSWFGRPVPLWPVVSVLLALMLAVNAILLYSLLQQIDGTIVVPGAFGNRDHQPADEDSGQTSSHANQQIFEVVAAVRGKGSNSSLAALDLLHFSKLKKQGDAALGTTPNGRELALGLMKLEALRLDAQGASRLLAAADNPTQVKAFFRSRNLDGASDARDMLAALACAAYGTPGLPVTREGKDPAVLFGDGSCKDFTLDKATPGLEELTAFVNELGGTR